MWGVGTSVHSVRAPPPYFGHELAGPRPVRMRTILAIGATSVPTASVAVAEFLARWFGIPASGGEFSQAGRDRSERCGPRVDRREEVRE